MYSKLMLKTGLVAESTAVSIVLCYREKKLITKKRKADLDAGKSVFAAL